MNISTNLINSCYPNIPSLENIYEVSGKLIDSARFDNNPDNKFEVYHFPDHSELIIYNGEVFSRTWSFWN